MKNNTRRRRMTESFRQPEAAAGRIFFWIQLSELLHKHCNILQGLEGTEAGTRRFRKMASRMCFFCAQDSCVILQQQPELQSVSVNDWAEFGLPFPVLDRA